MYPDLGYGSEREMPNPIVELMAASAVEFREIRCKDCHDMGSLIAGNWSDGIPAGVLYADSVPCTCDAGQTFAREQTEWYKPIFHRDGTTRIF